MISSFFRCSAGTVVVAALTLSLGWSADEARPDGQSGRTAASSSARPGAARAGTARGVLPDPSLLDGSTLQAEKKSETGMIGDFELPGDDNARSGKVGGPQNSKPSASGEQGKNSPTEGQPGGGGPEGKEQQQGGAQGGAQPPPGAQQQAGGAQAGGPENPNAAGKAVAGAGEQGAQPQGTQVAELGGDAAGQPPGAGAGDPGEKPKGVGIGDPAMRIEPSAAAAGTVGAQQQQVAGKTQQHEKGTGSGGKGPGGAAGGNRIEKGRSIPTGL